jgi:hypothetical protein
MSMTAFSGLICRMRITCLLTRARQGMVIYVPRGDDTDGTRPNVYYDRVVTVLEKCGLVKI